MGEVFLEGEGALDVARFLVSNDLDIVDGQTNIHVFSMSREESLMTSLCIDTQKKTDHGCINAANRGKDSLWIENKIPTQCSRSKGRVMTMLKLQFKDQMPSRFYRSHFSRSLSNKTLPLCRR